MTFHSGINGTATVNGTEPSVIGWDAEPTVEEQNFRNSKTGKFTYKEMTFYDMKGSLKLEEDFDNSIFSAPLTLGVGQVITNLKLYLNVGKVAGSIVTPGPFWLIPSANVIGTPQSLEVDGKIVTTINWSGVGTFTYPNGYVPA